MPPRASQAGAGRPERCHDAFRTHPGLHSDGGEALSPSLASLYPVLGQTSASLPNSSLFPLSHSSSYGHIGPF